MKQSIGSDSVETFTEICPKRILEGIGSWVLKVTFHTLKPLFSPACGNGRMFT